jgi:hypothetical protein
MTDLLLIGALILLANVALYAVVWKGVTDRIDPDPVLTPVEEDDSAGSYVWTATVKYDATENTERFVIRDQDELSKHDARKAIEDQVQGASVIELDQHRLYAFGPGATDE